jgi:uncharacterized repeat protein (TIGR01451 family)
MIKAILLYFSLLTGIVVFCQAPGIRWQRIIGGESYDEYHSLVKTNDNGIITIGSTNSKTGRYINNHGNSDVWIEKFDNEGISQWHRILGGTLLDQPVSSCYDPDGSLVVLCTSLSTNGDITNSHGGNEIWVFKLSATGNLLWQKSFGGSLDDYPGKIVRSPNGGYIVSAEAASNDGDLLNNSLYGKDWIFKISENGALLWQKTMGGRTSPNPFGFGPGADEWVNTFTQSPDGSIYLLTANGSSTPGATGNHGLGDIWLIKFDDAGVLQWQKSIGGTKTEDPYCVKIAPSGNIYVGGWGQSPEIPNYHNDDDIFLAIVSPEGDLLFQKFFGGTERDQIFEIVSIDPDGSCVISASVESGDGDIIGAHYTQHDGDLWLFKVSITGQIIWQKTLGGFGEEEFWDEHTVLNGQGPNFATTIGGVIKTQDGGFLVTSFTESDDGDIVGFHEPGPGDPAGPADIWVVKLSPTGLIEWQRLLGGSKSEVSRCPALEISNNNYIIAGVANSINGDVQTNKGIWDGWLINVGAVNRIKGTVFIDQNGNGNKDAEDSLYSDVVVSAANALHPRTTVPYKGNFIIETDTGTYNVSLQSTRPYYSITPASHTSTFPTYFNTDSFTFALIPIAGKKDLAINVFPLTPARPESDVSYLVNYKNAGTVSIPTGQVIFVKDNHLTLLSANPATSSISGDTLKWNYSSLDPLNERSINVKLRIVAPPIVNINDTLSSLAIITPFAGDITPLDDTAVLKQRVQGSFDPNDKAENRGGSITRQQVVAGEYINYFIRFQNTGSDTAFNIVVKDTLDNKLDWNSFQMITSSHPYTLQIDDQNKLIWNFYNIKLPDSNVNEPASHGYIAYRIKADNSLNIGASFLNRASIYFDFNLPVHTNFAPMVVGTPITLPLKLVNFDAKYQQPDAELKWTTADESNVDKFIVERGIDPFHFVPVGTVAAKGGNTGGETHYQFFDRLINVAGEKFYYRLRMIDRDNKFTYGNIALVKRNGIVINEVAVIPNPTRTAVIVANINYNTNAQAILNITDMQGRVLSIRKVNLNKGYNVVPLPGIVLPAGTYFLQVKAEGKHMVTPFIISD